MTRLEIPYRSQWDADANKHEADCGPTCVAMVLNYRQIPITPNEVYNFIPTPYEKGVTDINQHVRTFRAHNISAQPRRYRDAADALNHLRANIDAGDPMIVLAKYIHWRDTTGQTYDGGHFVVVVGYDDANIYMHDPLLSAHKRNGANFAMSHDLFCRGWGGFTNTNLNWQCTVVGNGMAAGQPVSSTPAPAPTPPAATPPPPAATGQTMDDVPRRIRALAAYRRTESPDFNNPAALQLWLDHLGDWGLLYDIYAVRSGDTLSGLAGRFYGQSGRWHAIRAYNDLSKDGSIWIGQTIMIPRLGESGAHTDPALPSDTEGFGKDIDLEDLVDPDLPANDYNALWNDSIEAAFAAIELEEVGS